MKNIVLNYRKITGVTNCTLDKVTSASSSVIFAVAATNYLVVLVNVACSKAKSQQLLCEAPLLFNGHMNVMLSRVSSNAYESVVLSSVNVLPYQNSHSCAHLSNLNRNTHLMRTPLSYMCNYTLSKINAS